MAVCVRVGGAAAEDGGDSGGGEVCCICLPAALLQKAVKIVEDRGAEPELESESESPGVVAATSQQSKSESESTKLARLRLRNVLFESVIQFANAGENFHAFFGNNLCRYCL